MAFTKLDAQILTLATSTTSVSMQLVETYGYNKSIAMIQDVYDTTDKVTMENACEHIMLELKRLYIEQFCDTSLYGTGDCSSPTASQVAPTEKADKKFKLR